MLFNLAVPHAIIPNLRGILWPGEPKGMSIHVGDKNEFFRTGLYV